MGNGAMNVSLALPTPAPAVNLHEVVDRAVRALRRACPERRVHHVMHGDGSGIADERGLLMALGIVLSVMSDETESEVFVYSRGSARYAASIEVRIQAPMAERSVVAMLDLHLARQMFERNGGTLDVFGDEDSRTILATLPRRGR